MKGGSLLTAVFYTFGISRGVALAVHLGLVQLCTTIGIAAMPSDPGATSYFVDVNIGSDSYSGRLADQDANQADGPLRTIQVAYDRLQPGDSLYIKKGVYRETLTLYKKASEARPIVIQAFPGDEGMVVINAAGKILSWTKCLSPASCDGNPNWQHMAYADVGVEIRQLFQNGNRLKPSRYPDHGWLYPTAVDPNRPNEVFYDTSYQRRIGSLTHSFCHIKTNAWHIDQIRVDAYAADRGEVVLESPARYAISPGYGYYFMHVVGDINEEGEWAYDSDKKRIYLWPMGESLDTVEGTLRYYGIQAQQDCSYHVIQGLVLKNAIEGIQLYKTQHITVKQVAVEYSYSTGICDVDGSHASLIDNRIDHSNHFGIRDGALSSDDLIQGNRVYATGAESVGDDLVYGVGYGIFVGGSRARVINNQVCGSGYSGLYVSGDTSGKEIAYNYITKSCLSLSDGGGIYTGGHSSLEEHDTFHHNIITDVWGYLGGCASHEQACSQSSPLLCRGGTCGIYLDEQGNHRVFEDNTVINGGDFGIFFHWTGDNRLARNTLFGSEYCQILLAGKDDLRFILHDNDLFENQLIATGPEQKTFQLNMDYSNVDFGQADGNIFYHPTTQKHIGVRMDIDGTRSAVYSLREWQGLSYKDLHSRDLSPLDSNDNTDVRPVIFANPTMETDRIDLGAIEYMDINGNSVKDTVLLDPFESIVLFTRHVQVTGK